MCRIPDSLLQAIVALVRNSSIRCRNRSLDGYRRAEMRSADVSITSSLFPPKKLIVNDLKGISLDTAKPELIGVICDVLLSRMPPLIR